MGDAAESEARFSARGVENNGGGVYVGGVSVNAKGVRSAWTTTRGRIVETPKRAGLPVLLLSVE